MAIKVSRGGEYAGETYIWCDRHSAGIPITEAEVAVAMFEGDSAELLAAFLLLHGQCDGKPGS